MVLRGLILAAVVAFAAGGAAAATDPPSRSLGVHWDGRLAHGARLPAESETFFTWDPVRKRSPNREWRRVGSDRLVRVLRRVLDDFAAAHPDAPRVGVGDLSRPGGGDFGRRFGGLGHVSHQNGLDADVYYPRRDRLERAPRRVAQVDRGLAQELVDRFVRAGALRVFVGPNVGLRGPRRTVQRLPRHDDHLHVRLPLEPTRRWENPATGHELQLPVRWRARVDEGTTRVSGTAVRIWLSDHGAMRNDEAAGLGMPLELGREVQFEDRGAGHTVVYRVGGHVFEGFVKLGRGASERDREQAIALLESARLTAFGRGAANIHSFRVLGRSLAGRPIRAWRIGNPQAEQRLLVVGCIHGDECEGMRVTQQLVNLVRPVALDLWVIQNLNPDGLAARSRGNERGVDLNRDFFAATQRETQIARKLILRLRPDVTIWFHQPQSVVRAWGPSRTIARRYARLAGVPYRSLAWPPGTASRWQNGLGQLSFVVELPPGELSLPAAQRHAEAVLALSQ
jgi:hypothetical protein